MLNTLIESSFPEGLLLTEIHHIHLDCYRMSTKIIWTYSKVELVLIGNPCKHIMEHEVTLLKHPKAKKKLLTSEVVCTPLENAVACLSMFD